ncbi:beta-galactosidase [Treponema sp.]|uniref:beta-galactosidase n=1 Tax=Treponema sp. TaxID=166 RepID=UPI00388D7BC8
MTTYSFDNKSLLKDGKRWFPVMGEIHYSRYPDCDWKEALLKMKEGGVDIVSSYVIWIHHEEIENEFDWTGWRNLRKFVETIKECGLTMVIRIGPWSHAEVRHGGFPDWLLAKCPDARSTNDEKYFAEVEKWYKAIYEQVEGLFVKDGGPIIGVQIENEYGHCGGLSGAEGEAHMKRLEKMAREIGFDAPLYTATGWGGAVTAGMLPVMGGYCESPWDPRITEIEPSGNYVFTHERNDHAIGCDFGIGETITFDMTKFPYLTAELGGGLQVTLKRRPVAQPKDIGGMSLAKMGSGCNLLGYYMYHGGQNPEGKLTTLEENIATGSLNDMSVKNYDFRAPLGQYGMPNGTYNEIKLYSMFVHDFGEKFAETDTFLPESNPVTAANFTDLRTSWRAYNCKCGKKRGWTFASSFQRRYIMADHKNIVLENKEYDVKFPAVDVLDGDFFFIPFNMKCGESEIATSLCTPLCRLDNERKAFVFYSNARPAGGTFVKASNVASSDKTDGTYYQFVGNPTGDEDIITLTREDAENAHKVVSGGVQYLLIARDVMYQDKTDGDDILNFQSNGDVEFKIYPALKRIPDGFEKKGTENGFEVYAKTGCARKAPTVSFEKISDDEKTAAYKINVESFENLDDAFIDIAYTANCARLYENGKLIDDAIYAGDDYPWSIGLKRYGKNSHEFMLELDLLEKDAKIFIEKWPEFGDRSSHMTVRAIASRAYVNTRVKL